MNADAVYLVLSAILLAGLAGAAMDHVRMGLRQITPRLVVRLAWIVLFLVLAVMAFLGEPALAAWRWVIPAALGTGVAAFAARERLGRVGAIPLLAFDLALGLVVLVGAAIVIVPATRLPAWVALPVLVLAGVATLAQLAHRFCVARGHERHVALTDRVRRTAVLLIPFILLAALVATRGAGTA